MMDTSFVPIIIHDAASQARGFIQKRIWPQQLKNGRKNGTKSFFFSRFTEFFPETVLNFFVILFFL